MKLSSSQSFFLVSFFIISSSLCLMCVRAILLTCNLQPERYAYIKLTETPPESAEVDILVDYDLVSFMWCRRPRQVIHTRSVCFQCIFSLFDSNAVQSDSSEERRGIADETISAN